MADWLAVHTDAPSEFLESSLETALLREQGVEVRGRRCRSEDETIACARDADAILNGLVPLTRRVLENAPRARVVVRYGVGFDQVDLEAATEQGIAVAYVPDYCVEEVSNHALAFLLAWARQLPRFDGMLHAGKWGYEPMRQMQSVHGQRLGLVGAGRIGRALGRKALALGMEVWACDPQVPARELEAAGLRPASLEELLPRCDYVSIHTPLTSGTRHLIGAREIGLMKPGAFLINTSRGPVVDEAALAAALREGRLAGAGLDVFEQEPLPEASPLRGLDNAILTPHMGAQSPAAGELLRRRVAEEVLRALRGEFPLHVANPAVRSHARLLRGA